MIANNANLANNGGNGGNARLVQLQRHAVVSTTTIKMCGGNTDIDDNKLTILDKIAMLEKAIEYKEEYEAVPTTAVNRLRPPWLPNNKGALKAMPNNKGAMKAMLPNGIVVSKKTTVSELCMFVPLRMSTAT